LIHQEFINSRKTFVPQEGSQDSLIVEVGEQPGKDEIFKRRPFIGPSGDVLNECNKEVGIGRSEIYLTNVIKDLDLPLTQYINIEPKKPVYVSPAGQLYLDILKEELSGTKANVIVAIGGVALYALCERRGITKWRGSVLESTLLPGRKIIPALHPATVIPPKSQYLNRNLIKLDLQRAKEQSAFPDIYSRQRTFITRPTFTQSVEKLLEYRSIAKSESLPLTYDIELYNEEISCISFSIRADEVICIPFIYSTGDYFTLTQESQVWLLIAEIMEDKEIAKLGQNVGFDSHFLLRRYGIHVHNLYDTMVAQRILYPDYKVGLDFITTMWTDIPYYKDEGKKWFKVGGTWETLWHYNCLDSLACTDAHPKQMKYLSRMQNEATYDRQRSLIEPLTYMQEHGTKVDVKLMQKMHDDYSTKIDEMQQQLWRKVGFKLNPNSFPQMTKYFYTTRGHKPYKKRGGKGGMTVNDDALKRLARQGYEEASIIRELRSLIKNQSTYLNVAKVDKDGRIRCSYNPVGTRYSRISSSENIFGTGMNMQNWPHELMKCLVPDDGYVYYAYDLSQFENRIVAYVGKVKAMITAFETGMDVHKLTAALIFNKPYEEISDEPGSSSIAMGRFSERYWGKKSNHALNYDEGYVSFSLDCEIEERDGKWIVNRYHSVYPEVRGVYHQMVRDQLAENRTLTNLYGRRTLFLGKWDDKLFKEAYSCIPQGTCGDKINEDGLLHVYYNKNSYGPVELLNQVHDSIGFQMPLSLPWLEHAALLLSIKRSLETPLRWRDTEFVVPVDLVMGLSLCKEDGYELKHKRFPTDPTTLATELEKGYKLCLEKQVTG
jgi:uracil-DNA glycosylase family 4